MKEGYKKIFWGIFIATFNINFGMITILPAFVGWIVVSSGISTLEEEGSGSVDYDRPKTISYVLIGATLVASIITLFQGAQTNPSVALLFYPVIVMTIELSLFHRLLEAAVQNFAVMDKGESSILYTDKDRTYIILTGISIVLVTLSLFLNLGTTAFFAGIFALIARIYLLTVISSLSK